MSTSGAFPGKKVLSPIITNIIQDQPSSNFQKQPSRGVVKKGVFFHKNYLKLGQSYKQTPTKKFYLLTLPKNDLFDNHFFFLIFH